jgi:hypothetical protein
MHFNTIEDVYSYIENIKLVDKYHHEIGTIWQIFRDHKLRKKENDLVKLAQLEMDVFNFTIRNNELHPMWSGSDQEGQLVEYPSYDNINYDSFEYIKNRFNETQNIYLRVRYSHLLWLSPFKNSIYAKAAVDDYLLIIEEQIQSVNAGNTDAPHKLLYYLKNVFYLSSQIKYKIKECISLIMKQIQIFKGSNTSNYFIQYQLLFLINQNFKTFKDLLVDNIFKIMWDITKQLETNEEYHPAIQMLTLGKELSNKLNLEQSEWIKNQARIYEILLSKVPDDLAGIAYCQQALDCYKQIKNAEKIKEMEDKFCQLKTNAEMQVFSQEIDLEKYIEYCQSVSDEISKDEPEKILTALMHSKSILPNIKEIEESIKNQSELTPLLHMLPITIHDQNGNPIQHYSSENEKLYYHILEGYGYSLNMQYTYLIHHIIYASVRENKLNINIVLDYFKKYCWFGKTLSKKIMGLEGNYNWLSQITGSLIEYFFQLKNIIQNQYYLPDLVMPIDSLTVKIEGLVRDLCRLNGITTITQIKDKNNKLIIKEKDLNMLLREKEVEEIFNQDDLFLFKYLLIEKKGINLRHKVAHGLMNSGDYSITNLHLLFICLLKLGKHDFVNKK